MAITKGTVNIYKLNSSESIASGSCVIISRGNKSQGTVSVPCWDIPENESLDDVFALKFEDGRRAEISLTNIIQPECSGSAVIRFVITRELH